MYKALKSYRPADNGKGMECVFENILTRKSFTRTFEISETQIVRWMSGELIQDVIPELSPEDREIFINGLDADEFNRVFGEA